MISFVFYTHSVRLPNLKQTLYSLSQREPFYKDCQKIVVFQDKLIQIDDCECYCLELDTYKKPMMCNFGVTKASFPIVALLDSDRILPHHYFIENSKILKNDEMITVKTIVKLNQDVPWDFKGYQSFSHYKELRSETNEFRQKNLFSGNTLFYKDKYFEIGGMDEDYIGYGFADNDMTQNALSKGCKQIFRNLEEIHLFHEQSVSYRDHFMSDFQILSAINLMKYCLKWDYYNNKAEELLQIVVRKITSYPIDLQNEFWRLHRKLKKTILL